MFYHTTRYATLGLLQSMAPPNEETYRSFVPNPSPPEEIEGGGANAKLLWIGDRNKDHVLLYFHGMRLLVRRVRPECDKPNAHSRRGVYYPYDRKSSRVPLVAS